MGKYHSDWIERNTLVRPKLGTPPEAHHYEQYGRPVIVCLCGSTRFYEAFQEANYRETMAGRIVLSVGFYRPLIKQRVTVDGCMGETPAIIEVHGQAVGCTPEQKVELDRLHCEKIDLADECLVLNVGGYVGESTRREVLHAARGGKTIRWLEPDRVPTEFGGVLTEIRS